MRQTSLLAALLALAASPAARADTVEASSTTLLNLHQDTRFRGGTKPDLVTVAPLYEILTVTARDISNGFSDDLSVVLSTWGAIDLAERRWDAGTTSNLTGDVTAGYVQAKFLNRAVTIVAGRSMVPTGVARMLQLDGGRAIVLVPVGPVQLSVSGYGGVPTSQRFSTREGEKSWNPVGGTLAYGGRVALLIPITGVPGRGFEWGTSVNFVNNDSDPVRQEVGTDLRLQPFRSSDLALAGFASYDLYDARISEASAAVTVSATSKVHLTGDFRYVEPSLLLSRNSILSVFSASTWTEYGGGVRYDFGRGLHAGLDLHLRSEPGATDGSSHLGSDVAGRFDWASSRTSAGVELSNLSTVENGYFGVRLWGRRDLSLKAFVTGDVEAQFFEKSINGESQAITGTVTAGYQLPLNFTVVVSGSAGMTPYLEQAYNLMLKLAYNQTYRTAEVK
jgi:hypothetical protein